MINYITGDATEPKTKGPKIIAHITNNEGGWGAGFVLAISKKWPAPVQAYRLRPRSKQLGITEFVQVDEAKQLWVANMCAQDNKGSSWPPVSYSHLAQCLQALGTWARSGNCSIHMPRIGCGIGGGTWDKVEPLLEEYLEGLEVYVYDLPKPLDTA